MPHNPLKQKKEDCRMEDFLRRHIEYVPPSAPSEPIAFALPDTLTMFEMMLHTAKVEAAVARRTEESQRKKFEDNLIRYANSICDMNALEKFMRNDKTERQKFKALRTSFEGVKDLPQSDPVRGAAYNSLLQAALTLAQKDNREAVSGMSMIYRTYVDEAEYRDSRVASLEADIARRKQMMQERQERQEQSAVVEGGRKTRHRSRSKSKSPLEGKAKRTTKKRRAS